MRWTFRCRFLLSSNIPPRTASQPTPSARAPMASGAFSPVNEADATVVGAVAPPEDALASTQELEAALAARGTPDAAQPATEFVAGELVAKMARAAESPCNGLAREGGVVGAGLEARTLVLDVISHSVANQVLGLCTRVVCRNCRLSSAAMFRACASFACCAVLLSTRVVQERFGDWGSSDEEATGVASVGGTSKATAPTVAEPPESAPPRPIVGGGCGRSRHASQPDERTKLKVCSVCREEKHAEAFDKGRHCKACGADVEALQCLLKAKWGHEYKQKYKRLKADEDKWLRQVAQFKVADIGRLKRTLPPDFEQLAAEVAVGRRHVKRRHHRKIVFGRFCAHYSKDEHGGYSVQQLKDKWLAETTGGEPVDTKGVTKGVCGHKRYRFEVSDSSDSEDVSERMMRHTRMTKPNKEMDQDNARDALVGRASYDADSDELPMETPGRQPDHTSAISSAG